MSKLIRIIVASCGVLLMSAVATAKTDRELTYTTDQLWNTAIRFFRVDMSFPISEKDKTAGYVLFKYHDGAKPCSASFELVPITRDGFHSTRLQLNIASMPRYVEAVLMDKLLRKLREEYGEQPRPRKVQPPPSEQTNDTPTNGTADEEPAELQDLSTSQEDD